MFRKYNLWFSNLPNFNRLIITYMLNWLIWFIASLISDAVFFEDKRSWLYHVFRATWMSFFMLIPLNLTALSSIFKSKKKS